MKNSTKTILDKHEKALDHTTAMIRLARLSNAVAFTLQVQCDANKCHAQDIKQRRILFEVMLKLRSVGTVAQIPDRREAMRGLDPVWPTGH